MEPLETWIDREYRHAAATMLASISPVGLIKERPGFGQTLRAVMGAIVASPVLAAYDPDPDYFFHWYRDSAVVIDALRRLFEEGTVGPEALEHLADFVRFSLTLRDLDGRGLVSYPAWRANVREDFVRFLRSDSDLASAYGDSVAAETRVNPDGTLDISSWPRPQNDGPAMRALALLRWERIARSDPLEKVACGPFSDSSFAAGRKRRDFSGLRRLRGEAAQVRQAASAELSAQLSMLLRADLAFTRARWSQPCFDIWEEEKGFHYYTLSVSAAALEEGARWLADHGQAQEATACRAEAQAARSKLDGFWLAEEGFYRSRVLDSGERSTKELDISVILAAVHIWGIHQTHSVHDPRMQATLERLQALFDAEYPINRNRPSQRGTAMGRYRGDVYYSGGAYYFSTLGAAEFCFLAAAGSAERTAWLRRGDAFLETVRTFTPPSGDLSEQFDKETGVQTSAKHLAWSYAAFVSCIGARRAASE